MVGADGQDRRGDRRARQDARQDRRLLRGRGRLEHPVAHLDHRADDDDRRRRHGRHDRDRDVPADVQAADAHQVGRRRASSSSSSSSAAAPAAGGAPCSEPSRCHQIANLVFGTLRTLTCRAL